MVKFFDWYAQQELNMKYIFFGKVYPERAPITISSVNGHVKSDDTSFEANIKTSIRLSQITVEVDTDSQIPLVDLKNTIENNVHTFVDVYGYLKGYTYNVEIISVYIPETSHHEVFGMDVVKITQDEKNRPLSYQDTLLLALKIPELSMVLKDLRDAIGRPLDTFFHCRRATETIAKFFFKSDNKAKGWQDAIKILGLNQSDINEIKETGGDQRHGVYGSVIGEKRVDIMIKTWRAVDKFVEYLKTQESTNKL